MANVSNRNIHILVTVLIVFAVILVGMYLYPVFFFGRWFLSPTVREQFHYPHEISYNDMGSISGFPDGQPTTERDMYTHDSVTTVFSYYKKDLPQKGWKFSFERAYLDDPNDKLYSLEFTKNFFGMMNFLRLNYHPVDSKSQGENGKIKENFVEILVSPSEP